MIRPGGWGGGSTGGSQFQSVTHRVLGKGIDSDDAKSSSSSKIIVDDINFEETKEYSLKMGKWRSDTYKNVFNLMFWLVMEVFHLAIEPLMHFFNFMKKEFTDEELEAEGSAFRVSDPNRPGPDFQF